MPTNNPASGGNFFRSRGNIVGIVIALVVLIVHFTLGLGFLWPVVAVAGWGAAVALIPDKPKPATPELEDSSPQRLSQTLADSARELYAMDPPSRIVDSMAALNTSLHWILQEWDDLVHVPETRVTITTMITEFLPGLVHSYSNVPDPNHPRAVERVVESLNLLDEEARSTKQAIIDNNVRALEDHTRSLYVSLGKLPDELDYGSDSAASKTGDSDTNIWEQTPTGDNDDPQDPPRYDRQP